MKSNQRRTIFREWELLKQTAPPEGRAAFGLYCVNLIAVAARGEVPREIIARYISNGLFIGDLDKDDQLEEIMHAAGELEVTSKHTNKKWTHLEILIAQLARDESLHTRES